MLIRKNNEKIYRHKAKGDDKVKREEFLMPSVEVITFRVEDIITTSVIE